MEELRVLLKRLFATMFICDDTLFKRLFLVIWLWSSLIWNLSREKSSVTPVFNYPYDAVLYGVMSAVD